jgi:putative membrane protein
MREIYGTFVERWYVTLLGAVFLVCAVRHLGWRRTFAYAIPALALGLLFENGSVHFGFPYTHYTFDDSLRGQEIFVGDVPLMVPLSYTFMGYFAFAAGRLVASGPWRTRARAWWHEYLLGVVLMVWAIWIFDPVARLGDRWFLGPVFRYKGPGFWFGLPLGSQAGFLLTALLLVGLLAWLTRRDADERVTGFVRHPHAIALLTYHGQIAWLAIVAVVLDATELGGSALLMWVPAAAITAVFWSNLRPAVPPVPAEAPLFKTAVDV